MPRRHRVLKGQVATSYRGGHWQSLLITLAALTIVVVFGLPAAVTATNYFLGGVAEGRAERTLAAALHRSQFEAYARMELRREPVIWLARTVVIHARGQPEWPYTATSAITYDLYRLDSAGRRTRDSDMCFIAAQAEPWDLTPRQITVSCLSDSSLEQDLTARLNR